MYMGFHNPDHLWQFIELKDNVGDLFIEYGGPIQLAGINLDPAASYTVEIDESR